MVWCLFSGYAVAILCTRFRDIAQIVASVLQVAFFVTPVIWKPEVLPPQAHYFVSYNPFAPLLAVVRDPLLGRPLCRVADGVRHSAGNLGLRSSVRR